MILITFSNENNPTVAQFFFHKRLLLNSFPHLSLSPPLFDVLIINNLNKGKIIKKILSLDGCRRLLEDFWISWHILCFN